jgi:hypothetical protein
MPTVLKAADTITKKFLKTAVSQMNKFPKAACVRVSRALQKPIHIATGGFRKLF